MSTLYLNARVAGRLPTMDPMSIGLLLAIPLLTGAVCAWRGRAWWFGALIVGLVLFGQKQLAEQGDVARLAILAGAAGLTWVGAMAYGLVVRRRDGADQLEQVGTP
ncbi:MAG: hypothetical protein JWQ99_4012 [Blastococcus sp.]|jgi:hypothetical protein|nr:hypothetical protein [Blastococcus sp.]